MREREYENVHMISEILSCSNLFTTPTRPQVQRLQARPTWKVEQRNTLTTEYGSMDTTSAFYASQSKGAENDTK